MTFYILLHSAAWDVLMIYNLDILLPLDTLGGLPVLLFLVSGSTPSRLFFVSASGSACYIKIKVLRVLPETKNKSTGSTPRVSSGSNIS